MRHKSISLWSTVLSKTLTVNNIPFEYPTSGDEPGWGGDATDWASEVTDVLSNVVGPNDILETSFSIANDQTSDANITGLVFDIGSVRSAVIEYNVNRISDSTPSGSSEVGEIHIIFDSVDGFSINVGGVVGNSGVTFSITSLGQFQYQSTDIGATNYSGTMVFSAKAKQQV